MLWQSSQDDLKKSVIVSIIAVVMIFSSNSLESGWVQNALSWGGILLFGYACAFALFGIADRLTVLRHKNEQTNTLALKLNNSLADAIREMSVQQLSAFTLAVQHDITATDIHNKTGMTRVGNYDIPDNFITQIITERWPYLKPIRDFNEGTIQYQWACALHNALVENKAATPAVGNRTTRVNDRTRMYQTLGWY